MKFKSDDQRRAVFANLNPGFGITSSHTDYSHSSLKSNDDLVEFARMMRNNIKKTKVPSGIAHHGKNYSIEFSNMGGVLWLTVYERKQDQHNNWYTVPTPIYFVQGQEVANLIRDAGGIEWNLILDQLSKDKVIP